MSSHFGSILSLTSFGESHGKYVGGILDGCPPQVGLTETDIQSQLNRRRPGQSNLTTDRAELDRVTIVSRVPVMVFCPGTVPFSMTAIGVSFGRPWAISLSAIPERFPTPIRKTSVPAPVDNFSQSTFDSFFVGSS